MNTAAAAATPTILHSPFFFRVSRCYLALYSCNAERRSGLRWRLSAAPTLAAAGNMSFLRGGHVAARAAAADAALPAGGDRAEERGGGVVQKLQLAALIGLWYFFNIYFNLFQKQVLQVYRFPLTVTTFHVGIGSILILLMWTLNLYKRPNISYSQLLAIVPLAAIHTIGNLTTNMSLGKVAVSFTHTIKAMEPFFTVVLSMLFLGESPSPLVLASLVPIVGGVALASFTEASFNWMGFISAMTSNLANQSRNVLSKKLWDKEEEPLDNINLFSIITIMSFFMSIPVMIYTEGIKFTPTYLKSTGLPLKEIFIRSLLAGLCFHAYQQLSYMILEKVSPVTHSVANCVKRVVVIVSSVLFFRTPISLLNSLGTGAALAGVFLYTRVKRLKPKAA